MHLQPITVPVGKDHVALIDAEDYELVSRYNWFLMRAGHNLYARANYKKPDGKWSSGLLMHRLILGTSQEAHIDHVNGDGLDNRRINLRRASMRQNMQNQKLRETSTSGFKGVAWQKNRHTWNAYIRFNGKQIHLGCFKEPMEAARAYDAAARELFGEFARPNFP